MRKSTKYFFLGACLLILVLSGCTKTSEPTTVPVETVSVETAPFLPLEANIEGEQNLRIDVVVKKDHQFTCIPKDELGGNYDYELTYLDVTNVSIEVDGKTYYLEDAIRDGVISVEEIFAYARMDARMGYCREEWETFHSLTYFIYRYPKFDLRLTYDVYKTPDGKEHLINQLYICENVYNLSTVYPDIDREDWGLTFEAVEATSTSLTINCTQSGGQQLGDLTADQYWIYTRDSEGNHEVLQHLDDFQGFDQWQPKSPILKDTTTKITLDWTNFYGELPKGNYAMHLTINDEFDSTKIHSLMEDYQDRLGYWIDFTIS